MINVFQPTVGDEELAALKSVLESSWLGRGRQVNAFEEELATFLGVSPENVITTNSCTEAMFQILDLIGRPGSNVVMPTVSFVGAANAVLGNGMLVNFCDVDALTGNPTLAHIEKVTDSNTVAILIQHFGGLPSEILPIEKFCQERGIYLIEDSAGSIASKVGDRACGTIGDFGVWSFDAMKMVVAGDGGAIYCRNPKDRESLSERMYLGMSAVSGAAQALVNDRWWEFDVTYPGRRSIMNDLSASMGRTQLARLPKNVAARRRNHQYFNSELANLSPKVVLPPVDVLGVEQSFYFYPLQVAPEKRDSLANFLRKHDIYTTFRYYPLHLVAMYGNATRRLEGSRIFSETTLLLPQHASLQDQDLEQIVNQVRAFFDA
jgi:dTDP-4-amino-4,6-dideoxygalactose transaminase